MLNWECYSCFIISSPLFGAETADVSTVCDCVENIDVSTATAELDITTVELDITAVVKSEIAKLLPGIVSEVVKETTDKQTTKWSEIVKENQTETNTTIKTTMSNAVKDSKKELVKEAMTKQDADNIEREKRCRNVVVKDVPEIDSPTEQVDHDWKEALIILDLEPEHVEAVFRAGSVSKSVSPGTTPRPRPLIITLITPELAKRKHNWGNGRKRTFSDSPDVFYINPDLILADRKAAYDARQLKRENKENQTSSAAAAGEAQQNSRQRQTSSSKLNCPVGKGDKFLNFVNVLYTNPDGLKKQII